MTISFYLARAIRERLPAATRPQVWDSAGSCFSPNPTVIQIKFLNFLTLPEPI